MSNNNTRVIKFTLSAKGKGLTPESISMTTVPIENAQAMELFKKISAAVSAILLSS